MSGARADRLAECLARHSAGQPILDRADAVLACLTADAFSPRPVIETDGRACVLDLGANSTALGASLAGLDVSQLSELIAHEMQRRNTAFAFGRWGEARGLYSNEHFVSDGESRTVHLGVDLFCAAGTAIRAPLASVVEIVANNTHELDYGPLVILRHVTPGGDAYFTLYGHLDLQSTRHLRPGQAIAAGEGIATVGRPPENGNWPPHLHFQIILDLLGLGADFPGVACRSQQDLWLTLSPNPARFFADVSEMSLNARQLLAQDTRTEPQAHTACLTKEE